MSETRDQRPETRDQSKYTIAISYDYNDWIFHRFASHIKRIHSDKFNFILFSHQKLYDKKNLYKVIFENVDMVFAFVQFAPADIKKICDKPILTAVNHWSDETSILPFVESFTSIVTVSREWRDKFLQLFPDYPCPVYTVHTGVETRFLQNQDILHPKTDGKIIAGFFAKSSSNENDRKGTRHFMALLEKIISSGNADKFHFILSGTGWEDIVSKYSDEGISFTYTPFTEDEDMPALYKSLDFYLMLSDIEGGPVTIVESMASKVLVLANNIGLVRDIGKHNENICIVKNTDAQDIMEQMLYYDSHRNEYDRMVDCAYQLAQNMTLDHTFQKFATIYEEFLQDNNVVSINTSEEVVNVLQKICDSQSVSVAEYVDIVQQSKDMNKWTQFGELGRKGKIIWLMKWTAKKILPGSVVDFLNKFRKH